MTTGNPQGHNQDHNGARGSSSPAEKRRALRRRARTEAGLRRKTRFTRTALLLDRLVASVWPLFAVTVAFIASGQLGLFGQAQALGGDVLRFGLLVLFLAAFAYSAFYLWRRFTVPDLAEARARLDDGHPDRPVAGFDEELALGREEADAEELWRAHQEQLARRAAKVRALWPTFRVGGRLDPFALRFFAVLGLGGAYLLDPTGASIRQAFAPLGAGGAEAKGPSAEIWASPPAYSGLPPLYFEKVEDRFGARIAPTGTVVTLRVFDATGTPRLTLTPQPKGESPTLTDEGDGVFSAEIALKEDATVALSAPGPRGSETLAEIAFEITPDAAPSVAYVRKPKRGGDAELTFSFTAVDDYGVAAARARIVLDPEAKAPTPPEKQEPVVIELPIPPQRRGADELASLNPEDDAEPVEEVFEKHPWVGLPVVMTLEVEDALGQKAESNPARFVLPGRLFSEPVAKALIEQRGAVSWNTERAPRANRILMAVLRRPDEYFKRLGDYLVARSAVDRLDKSVTENRVKEDKEKILEALYAAAEVLEDGGLENAKERLARAQRRLREAIENGASPEEIAELMRELREAVSEYMQALRDLAARNPELAEQLMQQQQGEGQSLSGDQLRKMLEALEKAAREGKLDDAEQMLSMLEQLLNSLQPGGRSRQAGEGDQRSPGQSELEQLQDMIERQQRLAEESFDEFLNRRQQGQQGQQGRQDRQGQQGQQGQRGQQGQQGAQGQPRGQGQDRQGRNGQRRFGQSEGGQRGQGFDPNRNAGSGSSGSGPRSLEEMRRDQQALRDALEQLRRGLEDAGRAAGAEESAKDREARRRALERAERALERAEGSMERAERALGRNRSGEAADEQMRAADAMRESGRHAREALRDSEAETAEQNDEGGPRGEAREGERVGESARRDPLGRKMQRESRSQGIDGYASDSKSVLGPDGQGLSRSRARAILQELRRRLGERERPASELEYLERLLERFR